jgi:hypothetical protein
MALVRVAGPAILQSKWVDHFEKWELIEIGIAGANASDHALAHENSRVRIMKQITGEKASPRG